MLLNSGLVIAWVRTLIPMELCFKLVFHPRSCLLCREEWNTVHRCAGLRGGWLWQ